MQSSNVIASYLTAIYFSGVRCIFISIMLTRARVCAAQGESLKKLQSGDLTDLLVKLVSPKTAITAPVFFNNAPAVITDFVSAVSFGFTGVSYAPCALPITPLGVGIFPQGINIQPEVFNIAPTGVLPQPFHLLQPMQSHSASNSQHPAANTSVSVSVEVATAKCVDMVNS